MSDYDLGGFEPFNDAHAIYGCGLSIAFAPTNDPNASWHSIRKIAVSFGKKLGLGAPKPSYGLNLTVDTQRVVIGLDRPATSLAQVTGFEFSRVDEDLRVFDRVIMGTDFIGLHTHSYIRWQQLYELWIEIVSALCSTYVDRSIIAIKLEYWDRFECKELSGDASKLIRHDSPYCARAAFRTSQPWNTHFFTNEDTEINTKRMLIGRIDVGDGLLRDGAVGRLAQIYTLAQDAPVTPLAMPNHIDRRWLPLIWADAQHDALKDVLSQIISENAIERIALRK